MHAHWLKLSFGFPFLVFVPSVDFLCTPGWLVQIKYVGNTELNVIIKGEHCAMIIFCYILQFVQ